MKTKMLPTKGTVLLFGAVLLAQLAALWIEFHPDDHAGIEGIYKKVASQFWQAVDAGRVPGLRASANK